MKLDWASINDFKGGWQFKHRRSFIREGTLDENVPRNLGVYMVLRKSSSATEFVENGTGGFYLGKNPTVQINRLKRE